MKWVITYYSDKVENEILGLPPKLLARYLRMTDLMLKNGPDLSFPHTRSMKEGLFEMRLKAEEGIARVFYCTLINQTIVVLHSFVKKTQKTPKKELKVARARLKEVK